MQLGKILYPITTLGIGKRIGIWTIGCNRNCPGCSNPELQFFNKDNDVSIPSIMETINKFKFDGVTISGGEPFLQSHDLKLLVEELLKNKIEDILVFTGYTIKQLYDMHDDDVEFILKNISVLIDGPYIESKPSNKILVGSTNQKIFILKEKYKKKYERYLKKDKAVDIFKGDKETHIIGVPIEKYREKYGHFLKG